MSAQSSNPQPARERSTGTQTRTENRGRRSFRAIRELVQGVGWLGLLNISLLARTPYLPFYFGGAVLIAGLIEIGSALVEILALPDPGSGAALRLATAVMRPGILSVVFIVILIVTFFVGIRPESPPSRPQTQKPSSSPAAVIAGVIGVVAGLATLAVFVLGFISFIPVIWNEKGHGRPSDAVVILIILAIALIMVLLGVGLVVLGAGAAQGVPWARFALLGLSGLVGGCLAATPQTQGATMIIWPAFLIAGLLIWAELRERAGFGSLRECWRGLALLVLNTIFLVMFAAGASVSSQSPDIVMFAGIMSLFLIPIYLCALLSGIWARNRDENIVWSGLNLVLIVASPILVALIGLTRTLLTVA